MWSLNLNFRWGAVLGQGEQDPNTGTKVLRGANPTQVTVYSAECQSMTCACDGIPRCLQSKTHLHSFQIVSKPYSFFTLNLSCTHLSKLISVMETVKLGSLRTCTSLAKPSAATQRKRGFEPSSAPNRRDSAGFWTSSDPNSLRLNAKHYKTKQDRQGRNIIWFECKGFQLLFFKWFLTFKVQQKAAATWIWTVCCRAPLSWRTNSQNCSRIWALRQGMQQMYCSATVIS